MPKRLSSHGGPRISSLPAIRMNLKDCHEKEKTKLEIQPGRWKRGRADAASEVKFLQFLLLLLILFMTNTGLLLDDNQHL